MKEMYVFYVVVDQWNHFINSGQTSLIERMSIHLSQNVEFIRKISIYLKNFLLICGDLLMFKCSSNRELLANYEQRPDITVGNVSFIGD
jgi:hypothetical protein